MLNVSIGVPVSAFVFGWRKQLLFQGIWSLPYGVGSNVRNVDNVGNVSDTCTVGNVGNVGNVSNACTDGNVRNVSNISNVMATLMTMAMPW